MEKVKVTQEQADAIEKLKEHHLNEIRRFKNDPYLFEDWLKPFHHMSFDNIKKSLSIGYEVEPKFKAEDWVFIDDEGTYNRCAFIGQVVTASKDGKSIKLDDGWSIGTHSRYLRHATPEEIATEKQRRWWNENGRRVNELKDCDVVIDKNDGGIYEMRGGSNMVLNAHERVVCFAEDRKDRR